jgi:hypothetical protein
MIGNEHGFVVPRPNEEHFPRRIREIQVASEGAGIGKARQIRHVLARAHDDGGAVRLIHASM